jgi:hypothetical protein
VSGPVRTEPRLITVIKRLAELEAGAFLTPQQMRELNALRIELHDGWPEVSLALAHAYMSAS